MYFYKIGPYWLIIAKYYFYIPHSINVWTKNNHISMFCLIRSWCLSQHSRYQITVSFFFSLYSITINWLAWISRYVIVALNVNMKWANDVTVNCYFFKLKYGMCLYCHRIFNFRMSWTLYDPVNWRNIELLDFEFEYVVWPYRHCTFFFSMYLFLKTDERGLVIRAFFF